MQGGRPIDGSIAPHERVRRVLAGQIRRGVWRAHSRLPADREVMMRFGVSRADVARAMFDLEDDGLIIRRRRRRSYVATPSVEPAGHVNGHVNGHASALAPAAEVANGAPLPAAAVVPKPPLSLPPAGYRLVWQRIAIDPVSGQPALDLLAMHRTAGQPPLLEARSIALDLLPEALAVDFSRQPPATWLASIGVAFTSTDEVALLACDDLALRLLRLANDEPCQVTDATGRRDGVVVSTGQLIRRAAPAGRPFPRDRLTSRLRRPPPRQQVGSADSIRESDSFVANALRFGQFLILFVVAVFRR